jgi:DNA recombination protein RmuC
MPVMPTLNLLLIGLVVGLAAGAALCWLLAGARQRAAAAEARQLAVEASATLRSEAAGLRAERDSLLERVDELAEQTDRASHQIRRAESNAAAAAAALTAERAGSADRERLLARRDAELTQSFQALSAEALARNNEAFVRLAEGRIKEATAALDEKAKGDATARAQAIGALLDPMAQTLNRVEGQLRTVEKERETAYAGLREQVSAMHHSSEQLVNALRAPQVRGRWGELQLERIVQLAGMVEHCDFNQQVHTPGVDGALRPDMVVHLAGGKQLVLDAKVPFAAYLEAIDARDPDVHAAKLAHHARQLRTHVDALSAKAYWSAFEFTPEFVVLFVPGDPFLEAALQSDPALLEHAFENNVVIATPTTLIALLRTVGYTWRQEALARNAARVHQLGRELHARLATMGTHVAKLGRSLDTAVESYNRTVASLEARVLVTARQFNTLHVTEAELQAPGQVERAPRLVQAPELVASASDALIALHELAPKTEADTDTDTAGSSGEGEDGPRTVNG